MELVNYSCGGDIMKSLQGFLSLFIIITLLGCGDSADVEADNSDLSTAQTGNVVDNDNDKKENSNGNTISFDEILQVYVDYGVNVDKEEKPFFDMIGAKDGVIFYMDGNPVKIYEFESKNKITEVEDQLSDLNMRIYDTFALETSNNEAVSIMDYIFGIESELPSENIVLYEVGEEFSFDDWLVSLNSFEFNREVSNGQWASTADDGSEFLILHFTVANQGNTDDHFIDDSERKLKAIYDGQYEYRKAGILFDGDVSFHTVAPLTTKDLFAAVEVPDSVVDSEGDLIIEMQGSQGKVHIKIR